MTQNVTHNPISIIGARDLFNKAVHAVLPSESWNQTIITDDVLSTLEQDDATMPKEVSNVVFGSFEPFTYAQAVARYRELNNTMRASA